MNLIDGTLGIGYKRAMELENLGLGKVDDIKPIGVEVGRKTFRLVFLFTVILIVKISPHS